MLVLEGKGARKALKKTIMVQWSVMVELEVSRSTSDPAQEGTEGAVCLHPEDDGHRS